MADLDATKTKLAKLEEATSSPDLWDSPVKAQKLMQEMNDARAEIAEAEGLQSMLGDMDAATELAYLEVGRNSLLGFN